MIVNFYEEFPTKENLEKLRAVNFYMKLYVAAKSIDEFKQLKEKIQKISHAVDVGWWPILDNTEGYWLSPFSKRDALLRVMDQIKNSEEPVDVMWDAELPSLNKGLFFSEMPKFFGNKKLIKDFFKENGSKVSTSENISVLMHFGWLMKMFGVAFPTKDYDNKRIFMYYTSMHGRREMCLKSLKNIVKDNPKKVAVGLGTLSTGVLGDEPVLSAEDLERDLADMQSAGVNEVYIFRLGGLTKSHLKVIKNYI